MDVVTRNTWPAIVFPGWGYNTLGLARQTVHASAEANPTREMYGTFRLWDEEGKKLVGYAQMSSASRNTRNAR
jgi:hypothetical protein